MRKRSTSECVIQESGQLMGIPYDRQKGKTLPSPTRTAKALSKEGVIAARYPRMGLLEPFLRSKSGGTTERQPSSCNYRMTAVVPEVPFYVFDIHGSFIGCFRRNDPQLF